MNIILKRISPLLMFPVLLFSIGIALRFIIGSIGFTFDLSSYEIVAKIVRSGGNVYAETSRYNYSPIWSYVLAVFYSISLVFSDPFLVFRFLLIGLLTFADVCIGILLYKRFSPLASYLFILSPISIVVTGFYSQFDNVAFLIACIAVLLIERSHTSKSTWVWYGGVMLLGLSICLKHICIFFPFWLFLTEKTIQRKIEVIIIPYFLFFISFLPFVWEGFEGIKQNVFLYRSFDNAPLWQQLIPDYLKRFIRKEFLFYGFLFAGAFFWRKKTPLERLKLYTLLLVSGSYAVADHYFAIVVPAISLYNNIFFMCFTIIQSLFYAMVIAGGALGIGYFYFERHSVGFTWQSVFLAAGILFVLLMHSKKYIKAAHIIAALCLINAYVYIGMVGLSLYENNKMQPIVQALNEKDYEKANDLYVAIIQPNPPFAGSRFYEKLKTVRYNIEYYRAFRHIEASLDTEKNTSDWNTIIETLQFMPKQFPYEKNIQFILETAKQKTSQK